MNEKKDTKHVQSLLIPTSLYEELRKESFKSRKSIAQIIREAIKEHFNK